MVMTDPIADMLTRIRNANKMRNPKVSMPSSNLKVEIANLLKEEGFIEGFSVSNDEKKVLELTLKYSGKERAIIGLKRVSKPGLRVYVQSNNIPKVLNGLGLAIISTSKGLMSDAQARKESVGGEVLAYIW
mgnify:CR=1 FL=1